jgi:L-alanine-DL-glutamate epimerase-like enolase superfamily enzyme
MHGTSPTHPKKRSGTSCRADPILAEPFELKNGYLIVPERPGRGITWSEKTVAKFAL